MPEGGFSREAFGPAVQRAAQASLWAAALALGWHFELLPCPWALLVGIPCPGCGLSRAAALLMRGDLDGAVLLHPLSPVLVPLVLAAAAHAAFEHVRGAAPVARPAAFAFRRWRSAFWCLLAGLVLALWAARFLGAFGGPVRVISVWGQSWGH